MKVNAMLQNFEMVDFYFQKLGVNNNFKPDLDTYCILLELYTKTKRYNSGLAVLNQMIQVRMRNTRLSPKKVVRTFLTEFQSTSSSSEKEKLNYHEILHACLDLGLL